MRKLWFEFWFWSFTMLHLGRSDFLKGGSPYLGVIHEIVYASGTARVHSIMRWMSKKPNGEKYVARI